MVFTGPGGRFQNSGHEPLNGLNRRHLVVDQEWLDPIVAEILACSPADIITEDCIAIFQSRHNAGMTVWMVVMLMAITAFTLSVSRERVWPQ
jgi:hypothetical protein